MSNEDRVKKILEAEGFYESSHLILGKILESFKDPILHSKAQKHFNFNEIVDMIIPLYTEEFNTEELDSILDFYSTDSGKKILKFKQTSNFKINEVLNTWIKDKQNKLISELQGG